MAEVEDVFELPPMQAGMLLHTLMAPESGTYFQQCWCILEGPLDQSKFKMAWQQVIRRHQVLRSECHWVDLDHPVQVIYDDAEPEWLHCDWSHLSDAEQKAMFEEWLGGDRKKGFQLDKAPLLRFALITLSENRHRFVWSFHHLLMDGWCGSLLVGEMLRLYAGQAAPPVPPSYRRYVEWREAQDQNAAQLYWRNALEGCAAPTPLGVDRAAAAEGGREVLEIRDVVDPELMTGLAEMARSRRLTPGTILQGAWALLLARYSGQDDVVFGTVLAGRPPELSGVENMVGLFLNTIPVRTKIDPAQSLTHWLQVLQGEHRQREKYGYAALSDIQRWAETGNGQSLFDSLLIVENLPLTMQGAFEVGDFPLSLHDGGSYERTHYPLTLRIFPGAETVLSLTIDPDRISPSDARRLLRHFQNLLNVFTRTPDAQLGRLDILDANERKKLLLTGRGPDTASAEAIHEQIFTHAISSPDKTALVHVAKGGDVSLSYAELAGRVRSLASVLQAQGVARGAVVAVCMERGPDLIPAILAVMAVGAAYLPIDPSYPAERIGYMLKNSGAMLILSDTMRPGYADLPESMAILSVDQMRGAPESSDFIPVAVLADDLAYILYTSGSTGLPKGVPITHGALANFMQAMARQPGMHSDDRLLALTTIGFDIAGLELFCPLTQGGTVVLTDAAITRDGAKLVDLMARIEPSVMQATPAGWRMLIEAGWKGDRRLRMLCGGEALDGGLVQTLLTCGGELWNLYGPTETTIWSAAVKVESDRLGEGGVPVAGPIDRTQLYVLDGCGEPVPVGISGELHIGGAGLSPGYWRRPDLTAEKFIPNPFRSMPQDSLHLYRTGDRVRWREDGTLEFLGRIDNQIKLRGFRIEPGEIEGRLAAHPDIAQVAVVLEERSAGARLVAYLRWHKVVPDDAEGLLRSYLSESLPSYMMPAHYIALKAFPMTPNNKVDRRALLTHCGVVAVKKDTAIVAFGEPARTVADIWQQILQVEHVLPGDNFFELGGHSLLVTRLQSALRERLEVTLDITDFFRFPTLETLVARIDSIKGNGVGEADNPQRRMEMRNKGRERLSQRRVERKRTVRT